MMNRSSLESTCSTLSFSSDIDIQTLASYKIAPPHWTDRIINAFSEKQRKLLIDTDGQSQLISVEESHKRLQRFGFGLATIFLIIATILTGIYIMERSFDGNESPNMLFPMSNSINSMQSKLSKPIPKMVLWNMMGHGNVYKFILLKNLSFALDWSIKLPSSSSSKVGFSYSDQTAKFIGYSHQKKLYMFSLSGKHDPTLIYKNNTHRTLPKSKFKHGSLVFPTSMVLSSRFMLVFGSNFDPFNDISPRQSRLWSIGRQKWIKGPMMPYPIDAGCGTSLNRTHVVIFTLPLLPYNTPIHNNTSCIGKLTLDVNLLNWIHVDPCFIPEEMFLYEIRIQSSPLFDKSGKMYKQTLHLKLKNQVFKRVSFLLQGQWYFGIKLEISITGTI